MSDPRAEEAESLLSAPPKLRINCGRSTLDEKGTDCELTEPCWEHRRRKWVACNATPAVTTDPGALVGGAP